MPSPTGTAETRTLPCGINKIILDIFFFSRIPTFLVLLNFHLCFCNSRETPVASADVPHLIPETDVNCGVVGFKRMAL